MEKKSSFERWAEENEAMLLSSKTSLNQKVFAAFEAACLISKKVCKINHFISWRKERAKTFLVSGNPNALNPNYSVVDYARAAFYRGLSRVGEYSCYLFNE